MLLIPFSVTGGQYGGGTYHKQYLSEYILLAQLLLLMNEAVFINSRWLFTWCLYLLSCVSGTLAQSLKAI